MKYINKFLKENQSTEELTPEALEDMLSNIMNLNSIEEKTKQLSHFKTKYPYVKQKLELRNIWWKYINIWYSEIKQTNKR